MKHVRDTSKDAYNGIKEDGTLGKQQQRILRVLEESDGPMSRREISEATRHDNYEGRIEIGAVTGRVNELIELGLIVECKQRECRFTLRLITPVELSVIPAAQMEMFAWGRA